VLLESIGGPEAPPEWRGALPLTYRLGGGPLVVHMRVRADDRVRPIWTVTGMIRGSEQPDQLVIVGNHRDAWTFGGVDPSSGTAALMELAHTLSALTRAGWRPKRSILFASWDAEEFTLTSSTEWGEEHAGSLQQNGTGITVLTGNNTYTGGTTISAGTLQDGSGGTTGAIAGNINNNAALVFHRSENTKQALAFGMKRMTELLQAAGASDISAEMTEAAVGHYLGTARMGTDPRRSVVDKWGRAHDVKNLFIIDGSVFTTAGAQVPTASIHAIALRTADYVTGNSRTIFT